MTTEATINPSYVIRAKEFGIPLSFPPEGKSRTLKRESQLSYLLRWLWQVMDYDKARAAKAVDVNDRTLRRAQSTENASPAFLFKMAKWIERETTGYAVDPIVLEELSVLGASERPTRWRDVARDIRDHILEVSK